MIFVKKLKFPKRKSGFKLPSGETTEVRGLTITNTNSFAVYVDKFSGYKNTKTTKNKAR